VDELGYYIKKIFDVSMSANVAMIVESSRLWGAEKVARMGRQ
jgi:hypothetical protein